jgi:F-type H+-transporting ATPase subunit alpha
LDAAIDKFKKGFQTGQGVSLSSLGNEVVNALEEEEVNQEKIVKQKR